MDITSQANITENLGFSDEISGRSDSIRTALLKRRDYLRRFFGCSIGGSESERFTKALCVLAARGGRNRDNEPLSVCAISSRAGGGYSDRCVHRHGRKDCRHRPPSGGRPAT